MAFCKTCGSPMPHPTRTGREAIVPAASMNRMALRPTDMSIGHHVLTGTSMATGCLCRNTPLALLIPSLRGIWRCGSRLNAVRAHFLFRRSVGDRVRARGRLSA
jgi:hypothetical protein